MRGIKTCQLRTGYPESQADTSLTKEQNIERYAHLVDEHRPVFEENKPKGPIRFNTKSV
jgi:hypothetical protein